MAIGGIFEKNKIKQSNNKKQIPDGIWVKCEGCRSIIFEKELHNSFMVCPKCNHHHPLAAQRRIQLLTDEGSFREQDKSLNPKDILKFKAENSYQQSIQKARKNSELNEAVISGQALINSKPVIVGVMDFRYIGGSMGSVVGEKVTRLAEVASKKKIPLIISCASGGARMQEGMISLMQMTKTAQAISMLDQAKIPHISILTNPTMGGVTASFATLADIIIAEPGALIGFAGPRVIEKTIRERLPDGFQKAEFLKERGMVDMIVSRGDQKEVLAKLIDFFEVNNG